MEMEYRSSIVLKEGLVVLEAEMQFERGNEEEIRKCMKELNDRRKEKQPLELPSAGSTFKRPEGNYAGKLIMDAGLSGFRIGNAAVSEKHCGFVVNEGGATADDIIKSLKK
jgi:UDP-N-acetylmuramate dehydrogenase